MDALAHSQLLCTNGDAQNWDTNPTVKFWVLVMEYAFRLLSVVIGTPNHPMIFSLCQTEHSLRCCYGSKVRTI